MDLQASIAAVTVYEKNARITRKGQAAVQPGQVELVLRGLPSTTIADSVRVRGQGTAQARLVGVDLRKAHYTEPAQATVQQLTERLRALQAEEQTLAFQMEREQSAKEFLTTLSRSAGEHLARGIAYARAKVTDGTAVLDFVRSNLEAVDTRIAQLGRAQEELAKRLEQAEAELKDASTPRAREGFDVVIGLEVAKAGNVELEVIYMVLGATWAPLYDLRLIESDGGQRLEVSYLAEVTQRSGEPWDNVELTLSTAKPLTSGRVPELDPWYLQEAPAIRAMRMYAAAPVERLKAPAPASAGAGPEEEPEAPAMIPMEALAAEASGTGPTLNYRVPRKLSVPSDGSPHKAKVALFELLPQLDYVTAPRLAETAHLRAKVTNSSDYVFLPGQANVFWGDEFVGRSALENIATGQEFELSLGVDERITVERKPSARGAEKVLLRDVRRSRYGYEIKLRNLTPQTQRVLLRDQIPVSTHERIVVRLDDATPQPTETTKMGLLEWALTLQAGEEMKVQFSFTVEHPRDMEVRGLPA
jgi:uncharacterized protein (TIGR02231 family)